MNNTHRSGKGKKLYALRDSAGRFKDIQTYQRLHRADLRRRTKKAIEQGIARAFSAHLTITVHDLEGLLKDIAEVAHKHAQP